jgi:hypothetical protein
LRCPSQRADFIKILENEVLPALPKQFHDRIKQLIELLRSSSGSILKRAGRPLWLKSDEEFYFIRLNSKKSIVLWTQLEHLSCFAISKIFSNEKAVRDLYQFSIPLVAMCLKNEDVDHVFFYQNHYFFAQYDDNELIEMFQEAFLSFCGNIEIFITTQLVKFYILN